MSDFIRFSEEESQDECLEIKLKTRFSDEQLMDRLSQNTEYRNLGELSVDKRNHLDRQIQREIGGSIRQLSPGCWGWVNDGGTGSEMTRTDDRRNVPLVIP